MVVRRIGAGREIVWLHGLGESSVHFEALIAAMPRHRHVLVDLPGYGRSAWPADGAAVETLDGLADHLARWLAPRPPAVVIGHSMGGVVATLLAARAPVRAIVDIEGAVSRGDCKISAQALPFTVEAFCAHGFAELRERIYADGMARPVLRGYHAALCFASPRMFHRHATDLVALGESGTLAPRLAALPVPTLYVAALPDGTCAASRALLDQHHVRWIGIEPAGHWVYLDQPARSVEAIERFLGEL